MLEVAEGGEATASSADASEGPAPQAANVAAGAAGSSVPNQGDDRLLKSLRLKRLGISQVVAVDHPDTELVDSGATSALRQAVGDELSKARKLSQGPTCCWANGIMAFRISNTS